MYIVHFKHKNDDKSWLESALWLNQSMGQTRILNMGSGVLAF